VIDQHTRVVLGRVEVDTRPMVRPSEITRFVPLLDPMDLTAVVVTADALHTQRGHVDYLASRGRTGVFMVKGYRPTLRRQLAELPWRQVEIGHRSAQSSHGRREIRTLKVVIIAAGILFPPAAQAVQLRRTRPLSGRGRWRTETVYAITDLRPHQARPDELAAWIRGALVNRERAALGP
jgi:hypothetical protein